MDKKPVAKTNANVKKRGSFGGYLKGVRTEMKKVVWPTKHEMVSYTCVVLLTCFAFSMLFWGFDSGFLALLKAVLNISL